MQYHSNDSLNLHEEYNEELNNTGSDNYDTDSDSSLGSDEEDQQITSSANSDEDEEVVSEENESSKAANAIDNPNLNLASSRRRDPSSQPARANEATDRNDTGSGGIPAGGNKSGSSLQ